MSQFYHLSTNVHSRGKGHSAVAAAAYRSGELLYDERTGDKYDWTQYREDNGEVKASDIFLPEGVDEQYRDRETLWNAIEAAEKTKAGEYKKTAAISREIENSLPHDMSDRQREDLARKGAQALGNRYKTAVDWSIHAPHPHGDKKNYHVHYLLPTREMDENGIGDKTELELSGRRKKELGFGTGKEQITQMRKNWADLLNSELERGGFAERVDHRSLKDQGIDRIPGKHMGRAATAMERRGEETRIGDENRHAALFNRELAEQQWQESIIADQIEAEERRIAQKQHAKAKKTRYDYQGKKQQRLDEIDQSKARSAKRRAAKVEPAAEAAPNYFDRDKANQDWKDNIAKAGIDAEQRRLAAQRAEARESDPAEKRMQWAENLKQQAEQKRQANISHAGELDRLREFESGQDRRRHELEQTLKQSYDRREQERLLFSAQERAKKTDTALGRVTGRRKAALEEAAAYQKNVDSIAQREGEQRNALEAQFSTEREMAGYEKDPSQPPRFEKAPAPLESYERAPPEIETPEPQFESAAEMLAAYEKTAAPEPEINQPEPEQSRPASEMLDQYEQAAAEPEIATPEPVQEPPAATPLEQYEQTPEPAYEPPAPDPVPEPAYEPPAPQVDNASAGLDAFEQAATPSTNDNSGGQDAPAPAQDQGQSQSPNSGGYER